MGKIWKHNVELQLEDQNVKGYYYYNVVILFFFYNLEVTLKFSIHLKYTANFIIIENLAMLIYFKQKKKTRN